MADNDNDIKNDINEKTNLDGSKEKSKKFKSKTAVVICVLVATMVFGVVAYAGGFVGDVYTKVTGKSMDELTPEEEADPLEVAVLNTLVELKKETFEATGKNVTKYFYEKEITDFSFEAGLPDLGLTGAFNVNAGEEVLTTSISVNDIVAKFMLDSQNGVLNFGSENYYGIDTATLGEELYDAMLPYITTDEEKQSLEVLRTFDYGYKGPTGSLKEVQTNKLSESYAEYITVLTADFIENMERTDLKDKQKVEKDGVTFEADAYQFNIASEDMKTYLEKGIFAAFLFNEATQAGEFDKAIDFENGTLTNELFIEANDEFVASLKDIEIDTKATLYAYDDIIVKTQLDVEVLDNYTQETEKVTMNLYILDAVNVLDNMQFDVVSNDVEVFNMKITSLNSGDTNEVGLDIQVEDEYEKASFGYTLDTTANKSENAVFYIKDDYSTDIKIPFTYNIIDDEFVLAIDSEVESMPFFINMKLSDKKLDQTMPTATASVYDLNENSFLEYEPELIQKIQELYFSLYQQ